MFSSKSLHNNFWVLPPKFNVFISSLLLNKQSTGGCLLYKETSCLSPWFWTFKGLKLHLVAVQMSQTSEWWTMYFLAKDSIGEQRCACVSCSSFSVIRVGPGMLPSWQYLLLISSWSFKHFSQIKFPLYILFYKGNVTSIYEACDLLTFSALSPSFVTLFTNPMANSIP